MKTKHIQIATEAPQTHTRIAFSAISCTFCTPAIHAVQTVDWTQLKRCSADHFKNMRMVFDTTFCGTLTFEQSVDKGKKGSTWIKSKNTGAHELKLRLIRCYYEDQSLAVELVLPSSKVIMLGRLSKATAHGWKKAARIMCATTLRHLAPWRGVMNISSDASHSNIFEPFAFTWNLMPAQAMLFGTSNDWHFDRTCLERTGMFATCWCLE